MRKLIRGFVVAVTLVLFTPATAMAHGIGGRLDLPVPLQYFVVGAAAVLVVSFVTLALLWPEPRLQDGPRYHGPGRRIRTTPVLPVLGLLSLLFVVGQIVPDIFGMERDPTRPTIAPVMVWVVFWLVVPFASSLVGSWYTDINPWRTIASRSDIDKPGVLERLGVWPATVVFVAFTWLELVSPNSGDPFTLGIAALAYTVFLVTAMAFVGRETGLASFDAFTPYNRLFSALAPVGRGRDRKLVWRGWLRALTVIQSGRVCGFLSSP